MKRLSRSVILYVAAIMILLMLPAMFQAMGVRTPGIEEAHAGGSVDFSGVKINRTNSDGTVYNGEEIYTSASDLASAYGMTEDEFTGLVKSGKVRVYYSVSFYNEDDTSMMNPIEGATEELETSFSTSAYRATINPSYYPHGGVFAAVQLFTSGESDDEGYGSGYNNNTKEYKIVDRFTSKAKLNGDASTISTTVTDAIFTLRMSSLGRYKQYGSSVETTAYDTVVRFFDSKNKEIGKGVTVDSMNPKTTNIPISYGENKITIALYSLVDGQQYFAESISITINSATLAKNTVYATRISSSKAIVRWTGISDASGYLIYQGSKKVKDVGPLVRKVTISRKGAGKAKFKVIPYIKAGGKIAAKGTSNKAKPKANVYKRSISKSYTSDGYAKGSVRLAKISGSGSKYTATLYAYNNRIFKLMKYKKITLKVYADGKLIGKKTIKNKKVKMKKNSVKKIVMKFKGKAGDLKYGTVTYSLSYKPIWEHGYTTF